MGTCMGISSSMRVEKRPGTRNDVLFKNEREMMSTGEQQHVTGWLDAVFLSTSCFSEIGRSLFDWFYHHQMNTDGTGWYIGTRRFCVSPRQVH